MSAIASGSSVNAAKKDRGYPPEVNSMNSSAAINRQCLIIFLLFDRLKPLLSVTQLSPAFALAFCYQTSSYNYNFPTILWPRQKIPRQKRKRATGLRFVF